MKFFGTEMRMVSPEEIPKLTALKEKPCCALYMVGENCVNAFCAGIVGTRRCDGYGRTIAFFLAKSLAACGVVIVSGGAAGIDTAAHEGALAAGGKTVSVLGCGFDVIYPSENRALFEKITRSGALISEYPPGTRPHKGGFAERNRIIATLSDILIAVQAPPSSGTLITAGWALSLSKPVFTIPGDIWFENSEGTNSLCGRGAVALHAPSAILPFVPEGMRESLKRSFSSWFRPSSRINFMPQGWDGESESEGIREDLSEFEIKVIEALEKEAVHMDKLLEIFKERDALFESLMRLEIKGIIKRLGGGFYALVKKV